MTTQLRTILDELYDGLVKIYGSRLKALRLFGSQAMGNAVEGSDIDVALILDDFATAAKEIDRTIHLVAGLSLKYDSVISLIPIRLKDWESRQTPFLMNLRRESIAIG